jgi:hypothetical protein
MWPYGTEGREFESLRARCTRALSPSRASRRTLRTHRSNLCRAPQQTHTTSSASTARLVIDAENLVVRMSMFEKLGALRGDVTIPLTAIRGVRATDRPWSELRELGAPVWGFAGVYQQVS